MISEITHKIQQDTGVPLEGIEATLRLIADGATIPFIARYRKEATGNLDGDALRRIAERYLEHGRLVERRSEVLEALRSEDKLTDELQERIQRCEVAEELEDLYLSFRPKKQSKAGLARKRGLEPLADYIRQQAGPISPEEKARDFIGDSKKATTTAEAIDGALHIVAERIASDPDYRKWLRDLTLNEGIIEARPLKAKANQKTKYSAYYAFREPVAKIPSHRLLAIRRGSREKVLSFTIEIDDRKALAELKSRVPIDPLLPSAGWIEKAIEDSYRRLLKPSIQNEVRARLRQRAENEAIGVFRENLSALLLSPPAGTITVVGIQPNVKGDARLAVVAPDGTLLEHHTLSLDSGGRVEAPAQEASETATDADAVPTPDSTPPGDPVADSKSETKGEAASVSGSVASVVENSDTSPRDASEQSRVVGSPTATAATPSSPGTADPADSDRTAADRETVGPDSKSGTDDADSPIAAANDAHRQDGGGAQHRMLEVLQRTQAQGVVIGNGSGARRAETFIRSVIEDNGLDIFVLVAGEAGATAYAASEQAREEFPDLDVALRSAVSIARRLQDPLAELVKIDPRKIGVGQYQHDVDQERLKAGLMAVVESAVNHVGVDLNTASVDLLKHVSGLSPALAKAIVDYRGEHGRFMSRGELRNVDGIDERIFVQSIGFLKVRGGTHPLDGSFVHPESYVRVEEMAASMNATVSDLIGKRDRISQIRFDDFVNAVGRFTLADIRRELLDPGADPRKRFTAPRFRRGVREVEDLKEGMELEGTVSNVTNFGAFVDVGVGQDGLVHISELSHRFVSDARQAVQVGNTVKVKVIGVDPSLKRISLSVKATLPKPQSRKKKRPADVPALERGKSRRRPRTQEAAAPLRKKGRRPTRDRPARTEASRPLSMEEKIRLLQEKFRSPES